MLDFKETELDKIVVHSVGNKTQEEELFLSNSNLVLDEDLMDVLKTYFLKPFKENGLYEFTHESGLQFNEVYSFCKEIFQDPEKLHFQSINLAKHLYETSLHPNIKGGEFYVVYFTDCQIRGEYADAIGIFKSETKDTFLKVYQKYSDVVVESQQGVNINKLDKGCLVFDSDEENGYRVCVVDATNKSSDTARYWMHDYLQAKPKEDQFYHTGNYMQLCKGFVKDVFNDDFDVPKTDQLKMIEKSMDYFNNHEVFNKDEFREEVITDNGLFEAFDDYKSNFSKRNDVQIYDEFDISKAAVKSQKKFFKSVLKLDKKFHVYVHGGHDYMEQGYDEERKMKFIKLFYNKEEE